MFDQEVAYAISLLLQFVIEVVPIKVCWKVVTLSTFHLSSPVPLIVAAPLKVSNLGLERAAQQTSGTIRDGENNSEKDEE